MCVYVCVCVCVCINYSYNHEIYDAVLVSLSSRQHQVYQNCVLKVVLCGSTLLCVCVCGWVGGCGCRVAVDHISSANIHIHRCSAQRERARAREREPFLSPDISASAGSAFGESKRYGTHSRALFQVTRQLCGKPHPWGTVSE